MKTQLPVQTRFLVAVNKQNIKDFNAEGRPVPNQEWIFLKAVKSQDNLAVLHDFYGMINKFKRGIAPLKCLQKIQSN